MFNLDAVQAAIRQLGFDGWLLYDFRGLKTGNEPDADGDKAFDQETFEPAVAEILSLSRGINS